MAGRAKTLDRADGGHPRVTPLPWRRDGSCGFPECRDDTRRSDACVALTAARRLRGSGCPECRALRTQGNAMRRPYEACLARRLRTCRRRIRSRLPLSLRGRRLYSGRCLPVSNFSFHRRPVPLDPPSVEIRREAVGRHANLGEVEPRATSNFRQVECRDRVMVRWPHSSHATPARSSSHV